MNEQEITTMTTGELMPLDEAFMDCGPASLGGQIEALLFASERPQSAAKLLDFLQEHVDPEVSQEDVQAALDKLQELYNQSGRGFGLRYLEGQGYQFQTSRGVAGLIQRIYEHRPRPLSRAALETLAIIAYRQPTTRSVVEFVRGVDSGSIIKNLMDRQLVKCVGRKEEIGRPMLFATTEEFLNVFSLSKINDLPPLSAFQPNSELIEQAKQKLDAHQEVKDIEHLVVEVEEDNDASPT